MPHASRLFFFLLLLQFFLTLNAEATQIIYLDQSLIERLRLSTRATCKPGKSHKPRQAFDVTASWCWYSTQTTAPFQVSNAVRLRTGKRMLFGHK